MHMHLYVCMCMHVCMYVCVCMCICTCMYMLLHEVRVSSGIVHWRGTILEWGLQTDLEKKALLGLPVTGLPASLPLSLSGGGYLPRVCVCKG